MAGLAAAMQRREGRMLAAQAVALRAAAWGGADEFTQLVDQLNGVKPAEIDDAAKLEAALSGLWTD